MRTAITLFFICTIMACTATAPSQAIDATNSAHFDALIDEIWAFEQEGGSGGRGSAQSRDRLADISLDAKQAKTARYRQYLAQLAQYENAPLSRTQQITLAVQQYRLTNFVSDVEFQEYLVPITNEYGFYNSYPNLRYRFSFTSDADFKAYNQLLTQIPAHIQQHTDYMRQGLAIGKSQPQVVLNGHIDALQQYLVDNATQSQFYLPYLDKGNTAFAEQAQRIIIEQVLPAYRTFLDFMRNEYIPQAKQTIAAKDWPNGEAYYQNRVKHYTTLDMTPEEIHQIGLDEVARIRRDMQGVLDALNYDGDIADFINFLRTDPQFYATSPNALIDYAMVLSKRIDAKLPKLFNIDSLPRTPYGVEPVPEAIAPNYTTGRYVSPRNDTEPGYYWVNTYALDKRPLYALPALTLHEAVPGHHLQIMKANEMQDLPNVRRSTYISAFGEGWGLYSEYLGKEVGFYHTPYDEFGRLSYEMWRACRLVVDTGMHMLGWSRQRAMQYMLDNTALSAHNVRTEIDRYIAWPAQALAYKLGEILIRDYRQQAEQALGEDFDVRDYHDAVLAHGSIPLNILEQELAAFIEAQQDAISASPQIQ